MTDFNGQPTLPGEIGNIASRTATLEIRVPDIAATAHLVPAAVGVGATDRAAIQAKIDAANAAGGGVVALRAGRYKLDAPLQIKRGVILVGRGRRRETDGSGATVLEPTAETFAAIEATGGQIWWQIRDLAVNYGVATGNARATNPAAIAFKLIDSGGGNYPFYFKIEEVSVIYAYRGFQDATPGFMYELAHFYCSEIGDRGIVKSAQGTTITLRNCYVTGAVGGAFYFQEVYGLTLENCAADACSGATIVHFVTCRGLWVHGLFMEVNVLGNGHSLVHVSGCRGEISGLTFAQNQYNATAGNSCYGLRSSDGAQTILKLSANESETRSGGGDSYVIRPEANGQSFELHTKFSDWTAPTGGAGTGTAIYTANNNLSRRGGGPDFAFVSAAGTVAIPDGARIVEVIGTTGITALSGMVAGQVVTLIFEEALTVTDGGNLKMAGNFVTTGDDTITFAWNGSNAYEIGRSVN